MLLQQALFYIGSENATWHIAVCSFTHRKCLSLKQITVPLHSESNQWRVSSLLTWCSGSLGVACMLQYESAREMKNQHSTSNLYNREYENRTVERQVTKG